MFAKLRSTNGSIMDAGGFFQIAQKKKLTLVDKLAPNASTARKPQSVSRHTLLSRIQEQLFPAENIREEQMKEIYSREALEKRKMHLQRYNKNIILAGAGLGLATVGWVYPLFGLLSVVPILVAAEHIVKRSYHGFKQGKVTVDVLALITIVGCMLIGNFWIGCCAMLLNTWGRKFGQRVSEDSQSKLVSVFRQFPKSAWILVDGVEVQTPFEQILAGATVVVGAGESIAIDGYISHGMATIDEHILTGESTPSEKGVGSEVFALTTVLSGKIHVTVTKAGNDTTVAQIGRVLNDTIEYKANTQIQAGALADRTVIPTLLLSGIAFPFIGPIGSLAILNSHFKDKVSVIVPISLINFLNLASEQGILIKDGRSLNLLAKVDTIVFDKTGTLTEEQPTVAAIHLCTDAFDEATILTYVAAAEQRQSHPIAKAILKEAKVRDLYLPALGEADYKIGYGLSVTIENHLIRVGSNRFMDLSELSVPSTLAGVQQSCYAEGHSLVMIAINDQVVGAIELAPTVRAEAKKVIQALKQNFGIQSTYMISGDNEIPTRKLANELGIDHYFAETMPEEKANIIAQLQEEGKFICYVGDGINDAIALKKSHVSISLRGASTVAVDTAQIILMDEKLSNLKLLFEYAQGFRSNANSTFAMVTAISLLSITGALFFQLGLTQAILLNLTSLGLGLSNSMRPLRNRKSKLIA